MSRNNVAYDSNANIIAVGDMVKINNGEQIGIVTIIFKNNYLRARVGKQNIRVNGNNVKIIK